MLLGLVVVELAVYRLAGPALRPEGGETPPAWYTAVGYAGLYAFYFASVLAIGALLKRLIAYARGEHLFKWLGYLMVIAGALFTTYAVRALVASPEVSDSIFLEFAFIAMLGLIVLAQLGRGGDIGAKLGLMMFAMPLVVHFVRDAGVHWLFDAQAVFEGLPERVGAYGQWSLVLAALLSPYCFAPRPFTDTAGKLLPLLIATCVALLGAGIMRQSYEVGYLLALRGVGVNIGIGSPPSQIALYLIALGSITWTLAACFLSPSPARRRIGIGLALIVVSGYSFSWPLQYLAQIVGFLVISDAIPWVAEEERASQLAATRFRSPSIRSEVWQEYVVKLSDALRGRGFQAQAVSVEDRDHEASEEPGATASDGDGDGDGDREAGILRTHVLVLGAAPVPIRLLVDRVEGSVRLIELLCGADRRGAEAPSLALVARSDRRTGAAVAGSALPSGGRKHKLGDPAFDRRFTVTVPRDGGDLAAALFDDELRERAVLVLDGTLAYWPKQSLVYQVMPGQNGPLDNPVPVTQLAFVGSEGASVDHLVNLIDFFAQLSSRALEGTEGAQPST